MMILSKSSNQNHIPQRLPEVVVTVRSITWEPTNFYATGEAEKPDNVTVIGGKTGTTKLAGNCLVLLTEDENNHPYISIVMNADTKPLLYKDMTAIVEAIPEK